MFAHLLKLIWNKKKQNFLLILEIFLSFIGLCAAFTFVLYPYNNYKLPIGLNDENVWVVNFNPTEEIKSIDSLKMVRESVKKDLLSMSQIENVSYCSANMPYSNNSSNTDVKYNGNQNFASIYAVEESYIKILELKMKEGR